MTATADGVLAALGTVHDPELDEPITALRFVRSCAVSDEGDVDVVLRLPTPQCAPNFAFLMAADARAALRGLPDVRAVRVRLEDHYTGAEINGALERGEGFAGAFPGETESEDLEGLRALFTRKALLARQAGLCDRLLAGGSDPARIVALRVCDLPDDPRARRCLQLRAQLGIACDPESPAFVLPGGDPVPSDGFERWLRAGRLVRTSLDANGGICRSLLSARHGPATESEEVLP